MLLLSAVFDRDGDAGAGAELTSSCQYSGKELKKN